MKSLDYLVSEMKFRARMVDGGAIKKFYSVLGNMARLAKVLLSDLYIFE